MLITSLDSPEKIWPKLLGELQQGVAEASHPFRYLTLATQGLHFPQLRTVVLREITSSLQLLVFTDFRSGKVSELIEKPRASLLFYHPTKKVQVRIKALASVHAGDEFAQGYWRSLEAHNRKEYTSLLAPGTKLNGPEQGTAWSDKENFFTVIAFSPLSIEVLQLSKQGHLRLQFDQASAWQGTWLAP
ncbi:MAG: general stress protein [Cyclobacteriaceae bacterium]|jgi:pyridoxamine 5'-phosphate oxidase|nr:general stress protein [Cyclobacteriaceae bacterium]